MKFAISTKSEVLKFGEVRSSSSLKSLFATQVTVVVGDVQDPFLDLGDGVVLQALSQAAATLLTQHAEKFNRTPLIKKAQLEDMVSPAGGPLKLKMGIDDVRIEVSENDLQLKVRFAFEQPQLTGE